MEQERVCSYNLLLNPMSYLIQGRNVMIMRRKINILFGTIICELKYLERDPDFYVRPWQA